MEELELSDSKWADVIQKMKATEKYFNTDGTINLREIVIRNEIFINSYERAVNYIAFKLKFKMFFYSVLALAGCVAFGYVFMIPSLTTSLWLGLAHLAGLGISATICFFMVISAHAEYEYVDSEKLKIKKFREQNNEKRILEVWEMIKQKGI